MSTASALPGFMLLDEDLHPIAFNAEAVQILAFPTKPERIKQLSLFLRDKIRSSLLQSQSGREMDFIREYKSGARRYVCRAFQVDCSSNTKPKLAIAVLLERHSSGSAALSDVARQFELTGREAETVSLLLEGLTSKEIANRMQISPNTVKAFLRLVMVKMDVSTRSGIVGKIVGPHP